MLSEQEINTLRANQRFLVREIQRRGIAVEIFDAENEILRLRHDGITEFLLDIDSTLMPYTATTIASSKAVMKRIFSENGISTPRGAASSSEDAERILAVIEGLKFPIVIKPSNGSQGIGVHTDIESLDEMVIAVQSIREEVGPCNITFEEQFFGEEHRIFITRQGKYAALLRDPAHVIGDGVNTIQKLIDTESHRRMNPRVNCLGEIVLNRDSDTYLRKNGLSLNDIPDVGEKVYIRRASNVGLGGTCTNITDTIHPSYVELARKIVKLIPGLPYAGIDIMSEDITRSTNDVPYSVIEINPLPGIGMHMAPAFGTPVNVASMIVDMIFPNLEGP